MDKVRGSIHSRKRACQMIDYTGLRYNNITPTDIDGCLDFGGEFFVFIEYKVSGVTMPDGQRITYEHIIDSLSSSGKHAVCIVAEHETRPEEDIDAAQAYVVQYRWEQEWRSPSTCISVIRAIAILLSQYAPRYL